MSTYRMHTPEVGLEINRINKGMFLSRCSHKMSMFDKHNIAVECGQSYRRVSVIGRAGKANLESNKIHARKNRISR
jgi:hypothetical protein